MGEKFCLKKATLLKMNTVDSGKKMKKQTSLNTTRTRESCVRVYLLDLYPLLGLEAQNDIQRAPPLFPHNINPVRWAGMKKE